MKTTILKICFIFLLLNLMGTGCEKDQLVTASSVGNIINVFELKYNDSKEISYDGEKIKFSIKNIKDSVSINCALVDFSNNQEAPLAIRLYAYLQINNQDEIIKVASKPCGALLYENNGHDIQDVQDLINDLKSAPANSKDSSYFNDAFINLFGEGSLIENTPFRIFMAKAYPTNFDHPNASIVDYKFIFIITKIK